MFVNILIALILATAVFPVVKKINQRLPRLPSILLVLAGFLIPFVLVGVFIVPNLIRDFPGLLATLGPTVDRLSFLPYSLKNFNLVNYLNQHASGLLASSKTVAYTILSVVEVFVLMFYFMLDHERLLKLFLGLMPSAERLKIKGMLTELASR